MNGDGGLVFSTCLSVHVRVCGWKHCLTSLLLTAVVLHESNQCLITCGLHAFLVLKVTAVFQMMAGSAEQ